jgi:hypothetical protein
MADKLTPESEASGLRSERAYAGKPRHLDQEAVRARAETQTFLPRKELHERQSAIGERRKPAGPALRKESRETRAEIKAPEVASTECAEPPDDTQEEEVFFSWGDEELESEEGPSPFATR